MTLLFDPEKHEYRHGGVVVPSVTQILRPVSPDFTMVPADVLERARRLGEAVDATITLHERNDLDEESLQPNLLAYLDAWRTFKHNTGFVVLSVQGQVYHPRWKYAGTYDIHGQFPTGPCAGTAVIDIKRTFALPRSVGPQTSAYAEAHDPSAKRYAMHMRPRGDGSIDWRLEHLNDRNDWNVFQACLVIYRHNKRV